MSQLYGVWRVNGSISVARSIGDSHLKAQVRPATRAANTAQNILISTPDAVTLSLDGSEEFLILACDGLWDVVSQASVRASLHFAALSHRQAVDFVHRHIESDGGVARVGTAAKLAARALELGSKDNVSVMIVYLNSSAAGFQADMA